MTVYLIRHTESNKVYVGSTSHPLKYRFGRHVCRAKKGGNGPIGRAIKEFGREAFTIEVLYWATSTRELMESETRFIALYQATDPVSGYNVRPIAANPIFQGMCNWCFVAPKLGLSRYCANCRGKSAERKEFKRRIQKPTEEVSQ